jgi:glycosyltransferase involved in cell wall biosynthesis
MSVKERARLTLALVTPRVVRGDGQGRVNYEIIRYALARGADVTVVATELDPDLVEHPHVHFIRGGFPHLPTSLLRSQAFSLQSGRWLQQHRERFEVLQSNGSVTLASSDVNTAHFIHAAWGESQAHPSRYNRNAYGLYHRLLTAVHSAQERIAYRRARHVVAISGAVAEQLVRIGVAAENISVIYNGVDTNEFAPGESSRSALGLPERGFLALFAGDMTTPRKNLETVLEALRDVPNVHLVVVGSLRVNPYPARAAAMGLADRVTFMGWRRDLPKIMQAVDAFVYPSLYEPLGLVVLEALACGLPIVTARATGASELIGPECGFVIDDANDHRALASALAQLAADPALRRSMGLAARATAERYTWEAMSQQYYALYERLAHERPQRA